MGNASGHAGGGRSVGALRSAAAAARDERAARQAEQRAARAAARADAKAGRQQRRGGAELEEAILDAAWSVLATRGYGELTYDAVATAAGTSRSVIYRRWPDRGALVEAAIVRRRNLMQPAIPDTGSLRGDLVALMRATSQSMAEIGVVTFVQLAGGGYYEGGLETPADVRERVLGSSTGVAFPTILLRAQQRGELDLTGVPERVLALPSDLLRGQMLLTFRAPTDEDIEQILDDVFFPALRGWGALKE
ncbi:MAG: TetR/AcrR family transcriptional regulator [Propionibacteriaceae bacterium]|jgi:AcrR family transcriptional regulator|nr:TetR/AcrR family transcriptional regulator [Propionibacteriaceae bacterium]